MNVQKLMTLLEQSEGPKLDFKEDMNLTVESGKKELAKDVIAIANSQGGRGYLVIGVKDKTKAIIGIEDGRYSEERIQQILSLRTEPPINVRVEYIDLVDQTVCVITIFRSYQKPHQMLQTGAFYIRRGSTTDVARREEIAAMLQRGGQIHTETIPLLRMSLDVYDQDLMNTYLARMNMPGQADNLPLLANLGYVHFDREGDSYCPTIGGMLLFCKEPQIYLPHLGIRIVDALHEGTSVTRLKGNVFSLMDQTSAYLNGLKTSYPVSAIEEAVFNAILHRDYFDNSRDILVYLSRGKVVVSNPGSIYGRERINNILYEYDTKRRNNWLYHQMLALDTKQRFIRAGTGLSTIKTKLKSHGRVRILNLRKIDLFKVVLPGIESIHE